MVTGQQIRRLRQKLMEGKTQEADYLLGKHLHPDYISVAEQEEIKKKLRIL